MRYALLALVFSATAAQALTYEISSPCTATTAYQGEIAAKNISVGAATIAILEARHIPYDGTEAGMRSILRTPTGDEALVILSDHEMLAYGWCYEIDGKQPSLMPDQVQLQGHEHLKWFYAFSRYKDGDWRTYCEPSYLAPPKSICR